VIANPGEDFEATDFISDSSVPRERSEHGGYSHDTLLALFELTAPSGVKPLWRGRCKDPAADISHLRSQVFSGDCH